jgi:glycogen operon protein
MSDTIQPGRSHPLGATRCGGGVNFSVYSEDSTGMELLLFDAIDASQPSRVIPLHPIRNRTHHYWHLWIQGLQAGQIYAYRAHGPLDPARGLRFDPTKALLDPYGRCVAVPPGYDREAAAGPQDNAAVAMKSVVADLAAYDWEGDEPLQRPFSRTVIYEMHLAGFTRHPSSRVTPERRGTYRGLIEKIPYLQDLGITAVELLPVFHFDPFDAPRGRVNYWGYAPVSFFAPHPAYSSDQDPLGVLDEFRDMIKALHRAGIEVILDVVYNHTAEGDERGPTLCYRGLQNDAYYILERDRSRYANYSGTGNTLNANHPMVRRLILDSLRYWVESMHVDGFRFDLASILSRDASGHPLANPPVLFDIETDPVLAGTKLIAEAWDAAGLYQVGSFVGDFWTEWNGRFRDDIRSFVKGDRGSVSGLASRLLASPDIYGHQEREPEQSINFVTCHDGFTLNDLVSYDRKHNEPNGEENRDGTDDNRSWNCGVEGPSDDPGVEGLRERQIKNLLVLNLLSLGTPMILMGDEVRRTQLGNNNAYCQDNPISWLDWTLLDRHRDLHRFVKELIRFRLGRELAAGEHGLTLNQILRRARVQWHGTRPNEPDWGNDSHSLACTLSSLSGRSVFHLMVSAYWEPLTFALPEPPMGAALGWRRLIDTAQPSPADITEPESADLIVTDSYRLHARSIVLLFAPQEGPE